MTTTVRWRIAVLLLAGLVPALRAWADDPPKERDEARRAELAQEAAKHGQRAVKLYGEGRLEEASEEAKKALILFQSLYPKDKYPDGHPELATSLNNLGFLLDARGELSKAEPFYRDALKMYQKLYPQERFPDGHPYVAQGLNNLGMLLQARSELATAEPLLRDALEMRQRLYPREHFPDGHSHVAESLNNLGFLLQQRGELPKAEPLYRDALEMRRELYPKERFPDGHPDLAQSLNNLSGLFHKRGELSKAEPFLHDALEMYQSLAAAFTDLGAETEVLNYLATLPGTRYAYHTIIAQLKETDHGRQHTLLWQGKAALTRVVQSRQRLFRGLNDERDRRKLQELLEVRRQLAALVVAPASGKTNPASTAAAALGERKERLEAELAAAVPALERQKARDRSTPADLAHALPRGVAFLDLLRYLVWDAKNDEWATAGYAAFVLLPGQASRRVELGDAKPIEDALAAWRQAIAAGLNSDADRTLRRLIWDKLSLPAGTHTVYLCPDGELRALPWAALPGAKPGSVLLEECAIALVPHGPMLLEQLTRPAPRPAAALLALGGVTYDRPADTALPPKDDVLADVRPADRSAIKDAWPALPGTAREADELLALAERLPQFTERIPLRGSQAGPRQLLDALPKARVAHLATHGYFAAPDSKEREKLYRPGDFEMLGRVRVGAAARHPLTQTGLVLAGANLPPKEGDPGGILTAEAIAGLYLDGLELAVLSACQTGLGEAQSNEGVFGLQRAFHLAGARNVVASLWKVDDDATAALMRLFYRKLWVDKLTPLEALRQAQLTLYRHPGEIGKLARSRGQDFDDTVERVSRPPEKQERPTVAPVKHWAAFVLSGSGR